MSMKKHIAAAFLGALLLGGNATTAQNTVTIPDANFVNYLTLNFASCMNGNLMDTTCALIVNSNGMSLYGKNISNFYGLQFFDNATILDISNNPATSLAALPPNLQEFTAQDIPLSALPALPSTLERINMKNNNLTGLPPLPASLWDISVEANDLASLPALPAGLFSLQVPFNNLTSLPALPSTMTVLNIYANQVAVLPTLPPNLTHLEVKVNLLSTLPVIPNTVTYMDVSSNNLTALPATLPPALYQFHCGSNQISSIPALPSTLWTFSCGYNLLTTLPALPSGLYSFYCQGNQISSLPALPPNLQFLLCSNNLLSSLPTLPDSMINISCEGNNIGCFPTLPPALVYNLFPNPATCLPNYTAGMLPAVLAYPLCVAGDPIINPNNCLDGTGIYGTAYNDANANCLIGTGESTHPNIPFELRDAGSTLLQQTQSTYTGNLYLNAPAGTYTVKADTAGMHFITTLCPGGDTRSVSLSALNPVQNDVDFDFECNGKVDLGVQSVVHGGLVFPGQAHSVYVGAGDLSNWYGFHCASGVSGQVVVTVSGPVTFSGIVPGTQTPAISGNTFTYTVSDFGTWDINGEIGLSFLTDTTAQSGNSVCVSVALSSNGADVDLANNTSQHCYLVVNSLDPNFKEVHPVDVPAGSTAPFTYTIHFQNNGMAPALNIRLTDTLDANLDLSTFKVTAYSHNNQVTLEGNALTVRFPNINLIDSATNYAASQGFFQYEIRPVAGLGASATVENTAHIYFDFNAPIMTNTTVNAFNLPAERQEPLVQPEIAVYPNPSAGLYTVDLARFPAGGHLRVVDVLGQVVLEQDFKGASAKLDLQAAADGIYFLHLRGQGGAVAHARLLKR